MSDKRYYSTCIEVQRHVDFEVPEEVFSEEFQEDIRGFSEYNKLFISSWDKYVEEVLKTFNSRGYGYHENIGVFLVRHESHNKVRGGIPEIVVKLDSCDTMYIDVKEM